MPMPMGLQPLAGTVHAFDAAQTFDVQRDTVCRIRRRLDEVDLKPGNWIEGQGSGDVGLNPQETGPARC